MKVNENYAALKDNYLFVDIARKIDYFQAAYPHSDVLRMGIGDVTRPLPPVVVAAMEKAAAELATAETFHGYGPEQGYDFLLEAIQGYYAKRGVALDLDEIFVSDGAKSDCGNILDLFDKDNTVLLPDPVYPVYVDANVMAGRNIIYMDATRENNFLPMPDAAVKADIITLCSPNNPTGAAYTREQLTQWVAYANAQGAVILFDAAYEAFVESEDVPHSIYEVPGADTCAIEICSLS
jgi:LL-diaminopimelate aminotransferase